MSTQITGEISIFLEALGQGVFDAGGLGLLGLVGPSYEDELFPEGEMYREFTNQGVTVLYEGEPESAVATAVFISTIDSDGNGAYLTPNALIDGLELTSTDRITVTSFFGDPVISGGAFDVFAAGNKFLHFEYDGEALKMITAMSEVPGL
ncbi:hypothetical protein [Flaviflexus massiliensis]|uniref:hypothetical protein n=1 Tax=Flaviflexus massiliensis TaxID=1522309 RepID=UPI0006D56B74|nr:hypothetical protein [Flaviflexus massiliensis]